jgi:hypothetical protein
MVLIPLALNLALSLSLAFSVFSVHQFFTLSFHQRFSFSWALLAFLVD